MLKLVYNGITISIAAVVALENEALILDFLEWISTGPRPYEEVMLAWRTSCPRLTIWEDATDTGLVQLRFGGHTEKTVQITPAGMRLLQANERGPACQQS